MPTPNPQSPTPNPASIFSSRRVVLHKARAIKNFAAHDFLFAELEARIEERLGEIRRAFTRRLDISGRPDAMNAALLEAETLQPAPAGEAYDLITSAGGLHWVNDLPGMLAQINRALSPDGLFIGVLPGGQTLKELRQSFEQAELALSGGISPRISPFLDVRDGGALLQRAGFALPMADSELICVEYDEPLKLLADLRGMGEANALVSSAKHFMPRALLMAAMEHYRNHFSNESGRVVASFELVTLMGWKPHASQPKPAPRGSAQVSLKDALG
jgi:NADH dehydrogenase [ubiquinone] 1 alpha subcomplex assembly factor 5